MIIDLTSLSSSTQTWARATNTADVTVTTNGTTRMLSGVDAAAYLFGQALGTIRYQSTLDGVQLTDGRFEFPPESGQWVSLSEVADALHYKYGVDPLIEFAPGLGLRGYSVADINAILNLLNQDFADQFNLTLVDSSAVKSTTQTTFNTEKAAAPGSTATYDAAAVSTLLDTQSTAVLNGATESELREALTEGGDVYIDRFGAFFVNGTHTRAMDVAVVSRLLVHDNIASEYKVMMDEYAERNNLIAESRAVIDGGLGQLDPTIQRLKQQFGSSDVLSELTAGQYSDATLFYTTDQSANTFTIPTANDPLWPSGTPVQVDVTSAGLEAGKIYFVRNMSGGNYQFFTSQSNAIGTGSTDVVDLTGVVTKSVHAADVAGKLLSTPLNSATLVLTPSDFSGNKVQPYDLLQHATYVDTNLSDITGVNYPDSDNYLVFSPIDPGWPEDLKVEFTTGNGKISAGTDYSVARWYELDSGQSDFNQEAFFETKKYGLVQDPWVNFIGYQFTSGAAGNANSGDNQLNPAPAYSNTSTYDYGGKTVTVNEKFPASDIYGQVMVYDDNKDIAGKESISGYTQFALPGTDFPTGTAFHPNQNVNVLLTHTLGGDAAYKSLVALHSNRVYYLRNEGGGHYSVYATQSGATNGGEKDKLYFAVDPEQTYTGTKTYGNYIPDLTATVKGIGAGITILSSGTDMSSLANPLSWPANLETSKMVNVLSNAVAFDPLQEPKWPNGTAVQTSVTQGGLTAGVTYYTYKNIADNSYSFYTDQAKALAGDGTTKVLLYPPFCTTNASHSATKLRRVDANLETSATADFEQIESILNTLISDKVRDGDLDQAKLQTLTAQLQNNTEAMTALIKAFADINSQLAQALR